MRNLSLGHCRYEERQVKQQRQSGGDGGNPGSLQEGGHAEEAPL